MANDSENESKRAQKIRIFIAEQRKIFQELRDGSLQPFQDVFEIIELVSTPKINENIDKKYN
jgi:hypothetical protein